MHVEDQNYESDFWEWVEEGWSGEEESEEDEPVEGFMWAGAGPLLPGESELQQKCWHVQEALLMHCANMYLLWCYSETT